MKTKTLYAALCGAFLLGAGCVFVAPSLWFVWIPYR